MIEAARQRTAVPATRSSNAWLPFAVLVALTPLVHARQMQAGPAVPAQETRAAPTHARGISAQAATSAATRDAPPMEATASTASELSVQEDNGHAKGGTPISADAADLAANSSTVDAAARPAAMRGVMFRIVPPSTVTLPAETLPQVEPLNPDGRAAASPAPAPAPAPAGSPTPGQPALAPASYLLATIHFGTPEEQGIDYEAIERTLAHVDTFVNEADLDAPWQAAFDGYRWLPQEVSLSKLLGKDSFAMARALLPNLRTQDLERMKPWSVLALLEARGETAGETAMDARLQRAAVGSGKRLVHLETLEQQLQALDCVPASEHSLVLDERLRNSWVMRIGSAKAMAWYRARNLDGWLDDIDRMEGLGDEAKAIEQRARQCLLEERNARWIGQLQTLIQDGPCLVAVGALHLVGPDGLLAALRRDGYRVEAEPL